MHLFPSFFKRTRTIHKPFKNRYNKENKDALPADNWSCDGNKPFLYYCRLLTFKVCSFQSLIGLNGPYLCCCSLKVSAYGPKGWSIGLPAIFGQSLLKSFFWRGLGIYKSRHIPCFFITKLWIMINHFSKRHIILYISCKSWNTI